MIRPAAVAGRFYPSEPQELARQVAEFAPAGGEKLAARGCVVPHAGYMYSGHVAGAVYSTLKIPSRCILLGPRHYPRGEAMAILSEGTWRTPLGDAAVDAEVAGELVRACRWLREDSTAHEREHSLEVQIPFLQRLGPPDFRFVPIVLAAERYPVLEELGHAVARVVAAQRERVLVIASTDMNHYEHDAVTRVKDGRAIERMLALDPGGLFDTVRADGITMCGYAATTAMLVAMRDLGAEKAELVRYATSGDVTGEREEVVGYAGLIVR